MSKAKIIAIAAVGQGDIIGNRGGLPWQVIPSDMSYFKEMTWGHPVVMGTATRESLPVKFLKGRLNVILSRSASVEQDSPSRIWIERPDDIRHVYPRWRQALTDEFRSSHEAGARAIMTIREDTDIFIIGGAKVYASTVRMWDLAYINRIDKEVVGDCFFPDIEDHLEKIDEVKMNKTITTEIWRRRG